MGKLIIILFFVIVGYASQILNISYFPTNSKVDILFSLDNPFKGKIALIGKNDYKITGITFNRIEQKKFDKNLNVIISGIDNNSVEVKIVSKYKIKIQPSVTAKGYGLRLRLVGFPAKKTNEMLTTNQPANLVEDNNGFNFINYIIDFNCSFINCKEKNITKVT